MKNNEKINKKVENIDGRIKTINTDFLVVGTGIAGLYTALKLSSLGNVTLLTKEQLENSNTQFAQGGIAAVLDKGDSWQLHMKDTIKAGAGLCNRKAVEVLVTEGPARVKELIRLGTNFDHIEGDLDLTQEGAHSRRRILHARGDATGVEIRESLSKMISRNDNIELHENTFMVNLLTAKSNHSIKSRDQQITKQQIPNKINQNKTKKTRVNAINKDVNEPEGEKQISGILAYGNNVPIIYKARAVILASGGSSRVYSNTSNPPVTTGDGIAAAYLSGAEIMDMEFVQFHPTTFYNPSGLSFLISESVRGEGAVLRNKNTKRFMPDYHHLADLAPRDIVARAIVNEARKDGKPYVYLDVTELDDEYIENRFPTIYNTLRKYGIDMRKELVPVVPAAHYLMGGIKTDTYGHSSIKGLYACGEVACTGVHGANRLASNSLLEGLVFGHRIFGSIKGQIEEGEFFKRDIELDINLDEAFCEKYTSSLFINDSYYFRNKRVYNRVIKANLSVKQNTKEYDSKELREKFRELMTGKAGIERTEIQLKELQKWIEHEIKRLFDQEELYTKDYEYRNMLINGFLIVRAAIIRKESRGGHYRYDYPDTQKEWSKKHIIFNKYNSEGKDYVLE